MRGVFQLFYTLFIYKGTRFAARVSQTLGERFCPRGIRIIKDLVHRYGPRAQAPADSVECNYITNPRNLALIYMLDVSGHNDFIRFHLASGTLYILCIDIGQTCHDLAICLCHLDRYFI